MRLVPIFSFVGTLFLLQIGHAFSTDAPVFQDGLLIIPTINTPDQVGQFQDARFELTAQGAWQLLDFKEVGAQGLGLAKVDKVELIKTDAFPVQVMLRVTGYFSDGCTGMGQINHRLENDQFNIIINATRPAELICTQAIVPFRRIIPLPVYGLSAGSYSYRINSDDVGAFELAVDNELPGDCNDVFECGDIELTF
ncbi:MAG: hypothetical protein Q8K59_08715 [Nitrosomonas sp.]|nr:hypothetical protein [Nitrosomonas sp.]MDP1951157.1 hypothetical protein [Nitrosomonas sp.]